MKVFKTKVIGRATLAAIAAVLLLSACGQKGSLYLPDESKTTYAHSR